MPARVVYLKKSRTHVRMKIVGDGTVNIPLSSFALPDETPVSPTANITFMLWSLEQNNGVAVVSRGGTPIQYLYGTDDWQLAQESGIVDNELNDQDISVNLQGAPGMIFMTVAKQGWQEPDTQAWDLPRHNLP